MSYVSSQTNIIPAGVQISCLGGVGDQQWMGTLREVRHLQQTVSRHTLHLNDCDLDNNRMEYSRLHNVSIITNH